MPRTLPEAKRLAGIVLLAALVISNAALAYYSFVRGGQRTTWDPAVFTAVHSGSPMAPAAPDITGQTGLMIFADAQMLRNQVTPVNCSTGGGTFGPPTEPEYVAVYDAMAAWNAVTTSTVALTFACLNADLTLAAFDNTNDEPTSADIFFNGNPHFNGINEIVFDDTTDADMIVALNVGLDPQVVLGLAFPFDTNQRLIVAPDANGQIGETFIVINQSGLLQSNIDLQGVLTELGHLLGLAHTMSVNYADGVEANVPTMYFRALSQGGSVQTRSLEPDDIAGITVSYPAVGEPLGSFGSISGQVLNSAGSNLVGAGVIAQDLSTGASAGKEISIIVGGNPDLDETHYAMEAVPAGSYQVRLLALNGSSAAASVDTSSSGNIDSVFTTPAFSFATQFFENSTDENSFVPVDVSLGSDTPNIDFTGNGSFNPNGLYGQVLDKGGCQSGNGAFGFVEALILTLPWAAGWLRKRRKS